MLCSSCRSINLNVFMPNGSRQIHTESDFGLHFLADSSKNGCELCTLFLDALMASDGLPANHPQHMHYMRGRGYIDLIHVKMGVVQVEHHMSGRKNFLNYWNETSNEGCRSPRLSNKNADAIENFDLIKSWISECVSKHPRCQVNSGQTTLPTRLIDAGKSHHGLVYPIKPRLVPSSDLRPDTTYLVLSHCWGENPKKNVPMTTTDNLAAHQQSVSFEHLSKTFQDALVITKRLGLRYIWIDSLCIVQDDQADFEKECARMDKIYSHAYCTIAAVGSPDSKGGCFMPRNRQVLGGISIVAKPFVVNEYGGKYWDDRWREPKPENVTIYPFTPPWNKALQGPLTKRGWCCQERELSPRIVHYTKDRILWECRTCVGSEENQLEMQEKKSITEVPTSLVPKVLPTFDRAQLAPEPKVLFRLLDEAPAVLSDPSKTFLAWYTLVEEYSSRSLTYSKDRLPALSGIAAAVSARIAADSYLAGQWRSDILRALTWSPEPHPNRREVKQSDWPPPCVDSIPSWSWASYNGPVRFHGLKWYEGVWARDALGGYTKRKPDTELLEAGTHVSSLDPFGRVDGGFLIVKGWGVKATISETNVVGREAGPPSAMPGMETMDREPGDSQERPKLYDLSKDREVPYEARVFFDTDCEELGETEFVLFELGVGKSPHFSKGSQMTRNGLVLMLMDGEQGVSYRRVGMFHVGKEDVKWWRHRTEMEVRII